MNQEYEREIVVLRILDREKERFKWSRLYAWRKIPVFNIVTKGEIEMLHIFAFGVEQEFERQRRLQKSLQVSEFCKSYFSKLFNERKLSVKSADFIKRLYASDIDKLIDAIKQHHRKTKQDAYDLSDLLI